MLAQASTAAVLPRVSAYLASLDDGIASWPDYRAKGSLVRAALRVRSIDASTLALAPPRLRALVERPPLDSGWITEVEYCAFSLLVADAHRFDSVAFARFWYDVMTDLVTSKIYATLLRWIEAPMLLRTTAARWGNFHRGLSLTAAATPDGLQVDLAFPAGLVPEMCIAGYTQVWQALIDQSHSRDTLARLVAVGPGAARWHFDGFR